MDYLSIILITTAAAGLIALAWLSGYEFGDHDGRASERSLADHRIRGILAGERTVKEVIAYENNRRPKALKNRRKAARRKYVMEEAL